MKAENIRGRVFTNHSLSSDKELGDILAPFGFSGFITNFGKKSGKRPDDEDGRVFCSCGYREGKYHMRWDTTTVQCPECGGKIAFIHVPRDKSDANSIETLKTETKGNSILLSSHKVILGSSSDEKFVRIEVKETPILEVFKEDGRYNFVKHPDFFKYGNPVEYNREFIETFSEFCPEFNSLMAKLYPAQISKFEDYISFLCSAIFSADALEFLITGILDFPNLFNYENARKNFNVLMYGLRFDEHLSAEEIYKKCGIPKEWDMPYNLFSSNMRAILENLRKHSIQENLELVSEPVVLWAIERINRESISNIAFRNIIKYAYEHNNSKEKENSYIHEYWEAFTDFIIENYDALAATNAMTGRIVKEFDRRVEDLRNLGITITIESIRDENYHAAKNSVYIGMEDKVRENPLEMFA